MKKKIYKYPIEIKDKQQLELPVGAEILSVQTQYGEVQMWALVDPNAQKETRMFEVFGTGNDVYYDMGVDRVFISTIQLEGGALVFHIFERL